MKDDLLILVKDAKEKLFKSVSLVQHSLSKISPYEIDKDYSPEESEPFDALSDRFIRAIEMSVKYFRTLEIYYWGNSSNTFRDILNNMQKINLITDIGLWINMRNVRNRIVHDYLLDEIKNIYDNIMNEYSKELNFLLEQIGTTPAPPC